MTKEKAIELLYRISDSQYDGQWGDERREALAMAIESLQRKIVLCKDCKFCDPDVFGEKDGVLMIVAHNICNKWGEGCQTTDHGYCFLGKEKGAVDECSNFYSSYYERWK